MTPEFWMQILSGASHIDDWEGSRCFGRGLSDLVERDPLLGFPGSERSHCGFLDPRLSSHHHLQPSNRKLFR